MQGDIVRFNGELAAVVSRSCDLPRPAPEFLLVAPVVPAENLQWLRGWDLRRIPVPNDPEQRVVDLTGIRSVKKDDLPHEPEIRGCLTEDHARHFGRDVGRFTSMPSHPDGVNAVVARLWAYLRGKRDNELDVSLIESIEDIRGSFAPPCDPRDEQTPRVMTLHFVVATTVGEFLPVAEEVVVAAPELTEQQAVQQYRDARTTAELALAVEAYCYALGRRCQLRPPVSDLRVDVISAHRFSYDDFRNTDPLRPDLLSHPDYSNPD